MILLIFAVLLIICLALGFPTAFALLLGYLLFFGYALRQGHKISSVLKMSWQGVRKALGIVIAMVLIGIMTGLWRACGTIPEIVALAAGLIHPRAFLLLTFLLCCGVSVLTGTSFGTSATMGVICMAMGNSMGVSPVLCGGAILSGIFFGDRCSPVSTSALLVANLTETEVADNIPGMIRTSLVPFFICCGLYFVLGLTSQASTPDTALLNVFREAFYLHPLLLLPAVLVLVLALCRLNVRLAIAASSLCAAVLAVFCQNAALSDLLQWAVFGYHTENAALETMLGGGGMRSMLNVVLVVSLSSSYAGIFEATGVLDSVQKPIFALSRKISVFGSILAAAIVTSMIACNQTFAAILTHQLCAKLEPDRHKMALNLENTVILVSGLIPWSIAGSVPLATVGAPVSAMALGVYLYLVPLWRLITESKSKK